MQKSYDTLQVCSTDSKDVIRKSYRTLQMKHVANPQMCETLTAAYNDILSADATELAPTPACTLTSTHREKRRENHTEREKIIHKTVEISLEQSWTGVVLPVTLSREVSGGNKNIFMLEISPGTRNGDVITITTPVLETLLVTIRVTSAASGFQRDGADLIWTEQISLKDALCGYSFTIQHPNGKTYAINKTHKLISPGQRAVLSGLGFPTDNGKTGDLVIIFTVVFPTKITDEQRDVLSRCL